MPALVLTAACAWLLNGLHSVPDNRPASRSLMDSILPLMDRRGTDETFFAYGKAIDDDYDDDNNYEGRMTLPGSPYGLTFFRGLRLGPAYPVPRFKSDTKISPNHFHFFFNIEFEDIRESFFRAGPAVRSEGPLRSKNRVQRTRRHIAEENGTSGTLFHLRVRGVALQAPVPEVVSDQDSEREDNDNNNGDRGDATNIDDQLTSLWRQFILDVTEKVPNRKRSDEDGYCCLTPSERQAADDGLYQNLCLSDFFNDCQWRIGSENEWDTTFNHLFPIVDKPGKIQNYRSTRYYKMWHDMKDRSPDQDTLRSIHRALRSRFDTLLWFPFAQGDRIWATNTSGNVRFKKFCDLGRPAPWVLCRERPSWGR